MSLMTNTAAMTALQTLQATNTALEETQARISTGYRVAEASDNAAYWSIATTLRSDNKTMSAVQDALGLGGATVDTAYTGLTAAKDVLDEIKAKLTAATQDGVDRSKVQSEISQLQEQLKSIASSASFSGANWLSVNSDDASYSGEKSIVASFARDANGSVSLGTMTINLDDMKLFDAGASAGILDSEMALVDAAGNALSFGGSSSRAALGTGGLDNGSATVGAATAAATTEYNSDGTKSLTFDEVGDKVTFDITVDGGATQTVTIARGTVQTALDNSAGSIEIKTAEDWAKVVQQALADAGVEGVTVGTKAGPTTAGASVLTFTSDTAGTDSNVVVSNVAVQEESTTDAKFIAANAALVTGTATYESASVELGKFTEPMTLTGDAKITFSIAVDAGTATAVTIDKSVIGEALGTTDGKINSAYEFQQVVSQALSDAGVTGVTVGSLADGAITFTSTGTTSSSAVAVTDVKATGDSSAVTSTQAASISVEQIDISTEALNQRGVSSSADIQQTLAAYISVVDQALEKVTTAAANLGSISNRIDLQENFLSKLTDTIDKGIGTLVDANMTEESTRLKALQTQQQLGVQALSIANQSTQSLLALFR